MYFFTSLCALPLVGSLKSTRLSYIYMYIHNEQQWSITLFWRLIFTPLSSKILTIRFRPREEDQCSAVLPSCGKRGGRTRDKRSIWLHEISSAQCQKKNVQTRDSCFGLLNMGIKKSLHMQPVLWAPVQTLQEWKFK